MGLTAAVLGVKVLVDGVERVLLLAAMFPRSQDVTYTLVQEGVLTLQHTHTHSLKYIITRSSSDVVISHIFYWFSPELPGLILTSPCLLKCFPALSILTQRSEVTEEERWCTSVWTMCWRCRRRSNTQPYRSMVPLESSCCRTRSKAMNVPVRPTPALTHTHTHVKHQIITVQKLREHILDKE